MDLKERLQRMNQKHKITLAVDKQNMKKILGWIDDLNKDKETNKISFTRLVDIWMRDFIDEEINKKEEKES